MTSKSKRNKGARKNAPVNVLEKIDSDKATNYNIIN